jgi:repressor LexA
MAIIGSGDPGQVRLSARQQRILAVIGEWLERHGYPPTVREIAAAIGLSSPSSVAHHLEVLERLGLLRRDRHGPRALTVHRATTAEPHAASDEFGVRVPLVGTIAAGLPIRAEEHVEDVLVLPATVVGRGPLFALRVRGDSMVDADIRDGDIVVVRQQEDVENGEIVAAMLDGDATVKVYRRNDDGHVHLVPRNPNYPVIPGDDAVLLGKVVTVVQRI